MLRQEMFIAFDGTIFANSDDCVKYEKEHAKFDIKAFDENKKGVDLFTTSLDKIYYLHIGTEEDLAIVFDEFARDGSNDYNINTIGNYYWDSYMCRWENINKPDTIDTISEFLDALDVFGKKLVIEDK